MNIYISQMSRFSLYGSGSYKEATCFPLGNSIWMARSHPH